MLVYVVNFIVEVRRGNRGYRGRGRRGDSQIINFIIKRIDFSIHVIKLTHFIDSSSYRDSFSGDLSRTSLMMMVFGHLLYKIIGHILCTIHKGSARSRIKGHPCGVKETVIKGVDYHPFFEPMERANP